VITIYRDIESVQTEIVKISDKNAVPKTAIMGLDEIQVSVIVDSALNISEGDYMLHNNVRYTLNRDVEYEIESEVKYSYDLIFEHPQYTLINKLLVNKITGSTNFTLTGKLIDFVSLVVWCVNKSAENPDGVDTGWSVGNIIDTEYKTITISDIDCRESLKLFAKEFDAEYHFPGIGKTINFVERIENVTAFVFEQGREKGLYKVNQRNVDKEDTVTRVYVRGGNKNVPFQYADEEGYLKLPENYLENFTERNKVVERKMKFEEEFPHFLGAVATVSGENNKVLTCPAIDFDIQAIAVGDTARINFLTGDLMGNSFEFTWDNALKQITLISKDDETALPDADGVKPTIPSSLKKAKTGDEFNFTGLIMPQSYVNASIIRLRAKGLKWLEFYSKKRVKFTIDIDHRWMRDKDDLKVGDLVVISIPQRSFSQVIRITQLEHNLNTGAISATVSNYLEDSWDKYLKDKIKQAEKTIKENNEALNDKSDKALADANKALTDILTAQGNISELETEVTKINNETLVALEDSLISEAERRSLYATYLRLDVEQEQLLSNVDYAINSIYMPMIYKDKLSGISDKLLAIDGSLDQYQKAINAILDHTDPHVTEYERAEYDRTFAIYSRDHKSLVNALRDSRLAIDAEIKRLANKKVETVEGGKNLIRNYDLRWGFDFWGGVGEFVEVDLDTIQILNIKGLADDGSLIGDENGNIIQLV